jgi:uncharacterized membrane protein HdeD (DUF308 family)
MGFLMMVLGLLAIGATALTGFVTVVTLGIFMIAGGLVEIVYGIRTRGDRGQDVAEDRSEERPGRHPLFFIGGILSVAVGLLFLLRPASGLGALTLLLAGYFIAEGLVRVATAAIDRYPKWGWDLVAGLVTLALGALVIAQWPVSAFWVVGLLIGVELFMRGILLLMLGVEVRGFMRRGDRLRPAPRPA